MICGRDNPFIFGLYTPGAVRGIRPLLLTPTPGGY